MKRKSIEQEAVLERGYYGSSFKLIGVMEGQTTGGVQEEMGKKSGTEFPSGQEHRLAGLSDRRGS